MSKTKTDQKMVSEAGAIIKGIVKHQKNSSNRMDGFDKQIADMKKAQRMLVESVQTAPVQMSGRDSELKQFVKSNGDLQWRTEGAKINIPGTGTVNYQKKGLFDSDEPVNQWHKDLIQIAQQRAFVRMILPESKPNTPKMDLKLHRHMQKAPREIAPAIHKAFNDQAGTGAEWIPDEFKPDLWEGFSIPRQLRQLLPTVSVDRNTVLIPRLNKGGRPFKKGEITSDDPALYQASTVETSQKTINIKGLAVRYIVDDTAMEDSAIALMPSLSRQVSVDLEDAFEDAMLNSDTNAAHGDDIVNWNIRDRWGSTGLGTAADHRRLFLGMRQAAFDKGTAGAVAAPAALAISDLVTAFGSMGELGVENRYLVCSPEVLVKHILTLDQVLTVDKFGPSATIVQGQIGSILGTPILMSRFLSADMNASGVYDNNTKTQSGLVIFNTASWYQYERRGIVLENSKDIRSGAVNLVATMRSTMDSPDLDADKNVAYLFNLNG